MKDSSSRGARSDLHCDPFESTHWSVVLAAADDGSAASAALETLCRTYWVPVYAYVCRRATDSHQAHDLAQGFFAQLLERKSLAAADPSRGRFRAFLLTSLKNYLANAHARAHAAKRGGGVSILPLDQAAGERLAEFETQSPLTPEQEFERRWALALLERVLGRLEAEQSTTGRQREFRTLKLFLTGQNDDATQADAARRLGITEQAVRAAVYRLRKRYRGLLRDEIAQTVQSHDDIDAELQDLFAALRF